MEADPGVGLLLVLCALLAEARERCDNGKFKLQMDLPPVEELGCPEAVWPLPELVIPSLAKVYPEQEAIQVCMDKQIVYNVRIPNSGMHRPNRAVYGEYLYIPAQRWVHNLQHGGIAFLYHPCVHPQLKEELTLLARACVQKHIITPHLNLSQERPLALVAWGKSLEMSEINLAEAVSWLTKSANQAYNPQVKEDGVYKFLLIQKARPVSDNRDGVICPADQVKKLQHYFKKRNLQSTLSKWDKVRDRMMRHQSARHVILRRRRKRNTQGPAPVSEKVKAKPYVATVPTGQAGVTSIRDLESSLVQTSKTQKTKGSYEIGQRQTRMGNESKFAMSVLKDSNQTHPRAVLSNRTANLAVKEPDSKANHSHSSSKADWTRDQQGETEKGEQIIDKTNQRVGTPAIKEQEMGKITVGVSNGLSGNRGQVSNNAISDGGKSIKPVQLLQNTLISSKNDRMKENGNSNKTSAAEAVSEGILQKGEMGINLTLTIHNGTAPVESGSIKCKCDGVLQNVRADSRGADSNDLKAAAEDKVKYVPTPRTEEAAWAAAALTFLFVFLTLAVLYTRLYKKFIKSNSLYWAPVPAMEGKENVADIIKRRITRLGKKRKKRPFHKKKSVAPYDVLPSDNSD
ncbi:uncharacterized protein tp53i13 [Hypanus sabinus]|uniref:uncharacterized protein tp53i13 n=1 Tax=Hypanus sabinus TaxID=79690 RepID=UPI0028C4E343|nr:uncharacterized protein tp53i13 [Hypanus sabinus]